MKFRSMMSKFFSWRFLKWKGIGGVEKENLVFGDEIWMFWVFLVDCIGNLNDFCGFEISGDKNKLSFDEINSSF
jgi:hypothetical protein